MAQAVNQQILPGNQQPIINVQQQILQNEDYNCIQLSWAAMGIFIFLCGMIQIVYPLTIPEPCHADSLECWVIVNAAIAIIAGSVGVLSGKTNNKRVNIGFRILAFIAMITSGVSFFVYLPIASLNSDVDLFVLAGMQGCESFACIIGICLTYGDQTKCCVKKSDRVVHVHI
ncbi:hypothetical protein BSL78_06450 [Apostichopus japonicus]|uniref:Transmembrane protein n=1 Tax=Stichopus japonicus TaxID=307972 RepID=A0A2G8L8U5_STIJA|nr:hypothetical protein BSL78_06450 [Apostichopus japonicus]